MTESRNLKFLDQIDPNESEGYGGKTSGLARLTRQGFRVPKGFAVPCVYFQDLLTVRPMIGQALSNINASTEPEEILHASALIRDALQDYTLPEHLQREIEEAFSKLECECLGAHGYAVRSSANIEDTSTVSFAGQATTSLCVPDLESVLTSIRETWFSLLSLEGLLYLKAKKIRIEDVRMGVIVQEMAAADVSGVMFTEDIVESRPDRVLIDSSWGLGEMIVAGKITPDSFVVQKDPLHILRRRLGSKKFIATPSTGSDLDGFAVAETSTQKRAELSLDDEQVLQIARTGLEVEEKMGTPQDIEWCLDDKGIILLQARPITTLQSRS